ncbi:tetratricopeptide repeat protein [Spirosoma taeanense]|nr:hypothetical protein [Spirosoma taeanense]
MAYWGVAMSLFHPLWTPPLETELRKGEKAVQIAQSLSKSEREAAYIDAIASFYNDWQLTDHRTRCLRFEAGMKAVYVKYPADKEAAVFYALALNAAADPADKSFARQKKAGSILQALYPGQPNHPGIAHYLIHTYDYPELARQGLAAARKYATIAPSSAHALHMPSHIFTRLGLWDECIQSNRLSVSSAQCYAEAAGIKGHWDEELHGLDYLVYAYLQTGDNAAANEQLRYIASINQVFPVNFKDAYTFAAAPSRMALENKNWKEAANIQLTPANFPWKNFPWQEGIIHFARLLGATHTKDAASAQSELEKLHTLYDTLQKQKDFYKAKQVAIQMKEGEGWIAFLEGRNTAALNLLSLAADMEDSTSKHPVTPGEVLPARELYADLLRQLQQNQKALQAYEKALQKSPNRFNSLYGAGVAAEKAGLMDKASFYYNQLISIAAPKSDRPELSVARAFLKSHS